MPTFRIRSAVYWTAALSLLVASLLFIHGCGDAASSPTDPPSQQPGSTESPSGSPPPSTVDLRKLGLSYVCDTRFRATNANAAPAAVTYRVDGTDERGNLSLPAALNDSTPSDTVFATKARATVRLLWHDSTITSAANAKKPCLPPVPEPSRTRSTVAAAPTSFEVGKGPATIKVTVLDSTGAPMAGVGVTLSVQGTGATLKQPDAPTDGRGVASGSLTATTAGTKTVSARAGSVDLAATASVTVTEPPPLPPQATTGQWAAPFSWPIVAVHQTLLPTGKVLSFGHQGQPQVWDPATGAFRAVPSPSLVFCAGHVLLPDGRILVAGGHISDSHGLPNTNIFDPYSESWSAAPPMHHGRWYPTLTVLANGDVLSVSGEDENGTLVRTPEVWSGGSWRELTGAAPLLPDYPRLFLAPDGRVFYAGENATSGYFATSGAGSWSSAFQTRLGRERSYGAAVSYSPGKILLVGGGISPTATAEVIDLNQPSPAWRFTGSMAYPRRHLNATVLADGTVLVTSGVSRGDASKAGFNDLSSVVYATELWNPTTGAWTTLAASQVPRGYHSTTLLLPDGRVLHAGSGDDGSVDQRTAEIFSPPYLFRGERPTITAAPSDIGYGGAFTIESPDAANIARVTLVQLSAVTHAFNMSQRFIELAFHGSGGDAVVATAPSGPTAAPLGHYMLFVINRQGVPSVAKIVRLR